MLSLIVVNSYNHKWMMLIVLYQLISSNGVDYVGQISPCFSRKTNSTTFAIFGLRYGTNAKTTSLFLKHVSTLPTLLYSLCSNFTIELLSSHGFV